MDTFDFEVGLEPQPATKPRKGKKQQNTAPQNPMNIDISTNTNLMGVEQNTNQELLSARAFKDELTAKELAFIEAFLVGGVTRDQAMITAGYGNFSQNYRHQIARNIIQKYEWRADDRRNLFRAAGAGELRICMGLLEIAQGSYPAGVRRAAWADLASCMGLKAEQIEPFQGVFLVMYGQEDAKRLGIQVEGSTSTPPEKLPVLQITK